MNKSFIICTLAIGLTLFSVNAQAQEFKAGLGAGYGTQIESIAVQGGIIAGFTDQFRVAADFKYFFPDYPSGGHNYFWEINSNLHYILLAQLSTKIYGLAGINFAHQNVDTPQKKSLNTNNTEIGLNLGVGAEYGLGFVSLFGEAKYAVSNYDQFDISAGLRFGL